MSNTQSRLLSFPIPTQPFELMSRERLCHAYVCEAATSGNPASVLNAIDSFGRQHWMMNVGIDKGGIIDDIIRTVRPKVLCELGCYVGSSAIRFASLARELQGVETDSVDPVRYFSFEQCSDYASIAKEHLSLAGLGNTVAIVAGPFAESIVTFRETYGVDKVDFVFIDHTKSDYLKDLRLLENSGLFRPGTVIVADNVLRPGIPDYVKYVSESSAYCSETVVSKLAYTDEEDGIEVSEWLGK